MIQSLMNKTILKQSAKIATVSLQTNIPDDLDTFYNNFEKFTHDETGETIHQLALYQRDVWDDSFIYLNRLYIKSQKIGLSTLFLLEDIHHALTDCCGKQIMIVAQTTVQAKLHLSDLIRLIKSSTYRDYLIEKPVPWLKKWEVTKATMVYMHNPKNPLHPTRIYALSLTPGSLLSFKEVGHLHISDPMISEKTIENLDKSLAAATSRTAITHGSTVIETPPRGPEGMIYDITQRDLENLKNGYYYIPHNDYPDLKLSKKKLSNISRKLQEDYHVKFYDFTYAIKAGLISWAYINSKKKELGPLFPMFFMATFFSGSTVWYLDDKIIYSEKATDFFNL